MKNQLLFCQINRCPAHLKKLQHPIVLLRGLGRSHEYWLDFASQINACADIVMIDLLGTGQSKSAIGRGHISEFAHDVLFTLAHHKISTFHLTGVSLGGMVSLEMFHILQQQGHFNAIQSLCIMASSARQMRYKRIFKRALLRMLFSLRLRKLKHKNIARYLVNSDTLKKNQISLHNGINFGKAHPFRPWLSSVNCTLPLCTN